MATVQVREVPEQAYEVLRRRARRAGKSLQAYLLDQLIELASRPSKEETVEQLEAVLAGMTNDGPQASAIIEDLDAERR